MFDKNTLFNIVYTYLILNFFKIIAVLSVFFFKKNIKNKTIFKKKLISVIHVNTFGDSLEQVSLIRLLNLKFTKYIIISTKQFPNNVYFPVLLKKNSYFYYNEIFYLFFLKILRKIPSKNGYLVFIYNHTIQQTLVNYIADFNFFSKLEPSRLIFLKTYIKKKKFNLSFKRAFIKYHSKTNTYESHKILSKLRENDKFNINNINNYSKAKENELLKKLGIFGKKFVCLFLRIQSRINGSHDNRSTCDLSTYIKTINFLYKKGYKILLFGSPNDITKNFFKNNKQVIDYRNSGLQNLENDFYIVGNCSFFISQLSGVINLPILFNKPILLLNIVNFYEICKLKYNKIIYCPKIIIKRSNNSKLSLKDTLLLSNIFYDEDFNNVEYFSKDISENQTLRAVETFLKMFKRNKYEFKSKSHYKLKNSLDSVIYQDVKVQINKIYNY